MDLWKAVRMVVRMVFAMVGSRVLQRAATTADMLVGSRVVH